MRRLPPGGQTAPAPNDPVARAGQAAGVPVGTLTGGAGVKQRLEQGFQFLAVGGDSSVGTSVQEARRAGAELRKKSK